ncbi:DUF541 domain-containing protein [Prolixibacteraceae bacterium JC049]|nr:DUF541 domain-containing protein [Prolixibacteraceae bacterium JC049]
MKYLFIALFCSISLISSAQMGGKNFIDQNYVEVTGTAQIKVTPDQIYLQIMIDEKQSQGKSIDQMEKLMIQKLKNIGVDTQKDLTIQDFDSNFRKRWLKRQKISMKKTYQLMVTSGQTAGKVYDELEKLGISNISVTGYDHSEMTKLKNDVRVKAILAAKDKATVLAEALGQKIGQALFIQEYDMGYGGRMMHKRANALYSMEADAMDAPAPMDFEKIELNGRVMVRFWLK